MNATATVTDLLVKLYALGEAPPTAAWCVRKPLGPEHGLAIEWVRQQFGAGWASEAAVALGNRPVTLHLALGERGPLGFACYDATARGLFGPIGVLPEAQRRGVGASLLLHALLDMRAAGYAYAVIGAAGPIEFFRRHTGAEPIAGSSPGLYRGLWRGPA